MIQRNSLVRNTKNMKKEIRTTWKDEIQFTKALG